MPWFYMSFADPTRPEGQQWLGGLFLEASDQKDATRRAWAIGENPGGQIVFWTCERLPLEEYRGRLLNKDELRRAFGKPTRLRNMDGRFA